MIKYRIEKMGTALTAVCAFFSIRALFWIYGMTSDPLYAGMSKTEIYTLFPLSGGDYFGNLEQMLVGTVLIVVTLEYILDRDETIFLLRHPSRSDYLGTQLMTVVATATGITICKFVVGAVFLLGDFGSQLVFTMDTGKFMVTGILLFSMYSIRCGLVYLVIRDLLNKKVVAIGITTLIYFMEFYIHLDNLLYPLFNAKWMPFLDLSVASDTFAGKLTQLGLLIAVIRQFGLTLICLLIWMRVWKRKDVIGIEK